MPSFAITKILSILLVAVAIACLLHNKGSVVDDIR